MATNFNKQAVPLKRGIRNGLTPAAIAAAALAALVLSASGQARLANTSRSAEEKRACITNLKAIYAAIEAFQVEQHDLPKWLSDLVPKYLADPNVLICPVCRRTGQTEAPPLADPKLPSSYLFEFCPVPLGNLATNAPKRTRRDWKRRQMGLLGSEVPIVRCRLHQPVLNLAFDGRIYESPPSWELLFTNRVNAADLSPGVMFAPVRKPGVAGKKKAPAAASFSARSPKARKQLLDLSAFYNAHLKEPRMGSQGHDLAGLPTGLQSFGGVQFDVRGIVQLGSRSPLSVAYPVAVKALPVHQACARLQFLHGAAFGTLAEEGKLIGTYVVHYARGQPPAKIDIRYGHEVRDCRSLANEPDAPAELTVAWEGLQAAGAAPERRPRLFLTTWTNAAPEQEIQSIDFVSGVAIAAPFVVAITAE